jgi:hypothetical protein
VDGRTNSTVGGLTAGAGNTIALNSGAGVFVNNGTGISILGNSVHGTSGLGIPLAIGLPDLDSGPFSITT